MNRFRNKKKVKDDSSSSKTSEDSDGSISFFGRRKKTQTEPESPVIDLENALPKSDDFRTSLLMAGLSARFSMLREQDDPNTKLGKASDDSVLTPSRQSRLFNLGVPCHGLGDIAEMPPMSPTTDLSCPRSIMSRSRTTEGNVLFGGRQKIYKIPAGAQKSPSGLVGRAVYDDDVPLSSFQRWRAAKRAQMEEETDKVEENIATTKPATDDPVQGLHSHEREIASTSEPKNQLSERESLAALSSMSDGSLLPLQHTTTPARNAPQTSCATHTSESGLSSPLDSSMPCPDRPGTRSRRLYERGLQQEIQDQQASALTRMDTLRRELGNRTSDSVSSTTSPTGTASFDLIEARRHILAKGSAPNLRTGTRSSSGGANLRLDDLSTTDCVPCYSQNVASVTKNVGVDGANPLGIRQVSVGMVADGSDNETMPQHQQTSECFSPGRTQDEMLRQSAHDSASFNPISGRQHLPLSLCRERPADHEHPALRISTLPTPMSLGSSDKDSLSVSATFSDSATTATLPSAGLGGLVRSHLRTKSASSSLGAREAGTTEEDGDHAAEPRGDKYLESIDLNHHANDEISAASKAASLPQLTDRKLKDGYADGRGLVLPLATTAKNRPVSGSSQDEIESEFAKELAKGAKRVRDRLNSFVESDSGKPTPSNDGAGIPHVTKPLGLGILKSKTTLGTLVDRHRETNGSSKTVGKLIVGPPLASVSQLISQFNPSNEASPDVPVSPTFIGPEQVGKKHTTSPVKVKIQDQTSNDAISLEEFSRHSFPEGHVNNIALGVDQEPTPCLSADCVPHQPTAAQSSSSQENLKHPAESAADNCHDSLARTQIHPGIKAFRQARRGLMELKPTELRTRGQVFGPEQSEPPGQANAPLCGNRYMQSPRMNKGRMPPQTCYNESHSAANGLMPPQPGNARFLGLSNNNDVLADGSQRRVCNPSSCTYSSSQQPFNRITANGNEARPLLQQHSAPHLSTWRRGDSRPVLPLDDSRRSQRKQQDSRNLPNNPHDTAYSAHNEFVTRQCGGRTNGLTGTHSTVSGSPTTWSGRPQATSHAPGPGFPSNKPDKLQAHTRHLVHEPSHGQSRGAPALDPLISVPFGYHGKSSRGPQFSGTIPLKTGPAVPLRMEETSRENMRPNSPLRLPIHQTELSLPPQSESNSSSPTLGIWSVAGAVRPAHNDFMS